MHTHVSTALASWFLRDSLSGGVAGVMILWLAHDGCDRHMVVVMIMRIIIVMVCKPVMPSDGSSE